jgi:putative heme-binding domain-containing protein
MVVGKRLSVILALGSLSFLVAVPAFSQKENEQGSAKKAEAKSNASPNTAEVVLKTLPRPKKDALPASKLSLEFVKHERLALVGNSTGERMNLFGFFEAALHQGFPKQELIVRNFCRPADELALRQRASDYTKLDDPLYAYNPDTFLCFFGYNESFAGKDGVEKYKADYLKYLDEITKKYPRDDAGSPPRFVLISPIAFENTGDEHLPDGKEINTNLKLYAAATAEVAKERGLAYVDILDPTLAVFQAAVGKNYTINGCHVNEAGDRAVATALYQGLFGTVPNLGGSAFEKIRAIVNDKSWVHLQDYRMLNGWYVYGGRRTWDTETFPKEYVKIRNMAAVRDEYLWNLAQGKDIPARPDDSQTGELFTPPTRFGAPDQIQGKRSETELFYLEPDAFIKTCKVPDGFEVKLFADEKQFPEIAKPVQMTFDAKGRLWISTMPSYPQWKPGDPKPSDKIVILEDTDNDGRADKRTVFYDQLHCPTGFEFYNGGVIVVSQPRLLFLKDTNGDDVADQVTEILDGFATEDTHHTVGAFEWSHGGYLKMLEGVSMSTTVETPWGPLRNYGSSGCYTLDPHSEKISHYVTPGYGNPWCYVFNEWGQGIVGDGTGAAQHWDTLLSGAQFQGRQGIAATINPEGMRPVCGSDLLRTRQFPDELQNKFIFACVINMNGLTIFDFGEDGSGYKGTRMKMKDADGKPVKDKDGKDVPFDLLSSTHRHFRPVDPQVGPDGAIWFGDWANALIGHMQYSQRDPNRNHDLGRIYRLVNTKKPLLQPVLQHGKSVAELLDQLKEYENRTRYRARRELWARPLTEVKPAVEKWVAELKPTEPDYDRLICEGLWVLQGHRAVTLDLLNKALALSSPNARAAAVKIAVDERESLRDAVEILKKYAVDESPRVRIEAVRGLSFYKKADATDAVLAAAKLPSDMWLKYVLNCTLGATESAWTGRYVAKKIGQDDKELAKMLDEIIKGSKTIGLAVPYLKILLGANDASAEERNKAMAALASMKGNADRGKAIFRNATCISCHKVFGEGASYGPDMMGVGKRWNKAKIIESIIDPNAEIDKKYVTLQIVTSAGKTIQGLLVSEDEKEVVIFDGKKPQKIAVADIDERNQLKQSSMPEGLAGTMAPNEFLDLVEFLSTLK